MRVGPLCLPGGFPCQLLLQPVIRRPGLQWVSPELCGRQAGSKQASQEVNKGISDDKTGLGISSRERRPARKVRAGWVEAMQGLGASVALSGS